MTKRVGLGETKPNERLRRRRLADAELCGRGETRGGSAHARPRRSGARVTRWAALPAKLASGRAAAAARRAASAVTEGGAEGFAPCRRMTPPTLTTATLARSREPEAEVERVPSGRRAEEVHGRGMKAPEAPCSRARRRSSARRSPPTRAAPLSSARRRRRWCRRRCCRRRGSTCQPPVIGFNESSARLRAAAAARRAKLALIAPARDVGLTTFGRGRPERAASDVAVLTKCENVFRDGAMATLKKEWGLEVEMFLRTSNRRRRRCETRCSASARPRVRLRHRGGGVARAAPSRGRRGDGPRRERGRARSSPARYSFRPSRAAAAPSRRGARRGRRAQLRARLVAHGARSLRTRGAAVEGGSSRPRSALANFCSQARTRSRRTARALFSRAADGRTAAEGGAHSSSGDGRSRGRSGDTSRARKRRTPDHLAPPRPPSRPWSRLDASGDGAAPLDQNAVGQLEARPPQAAAAAAAANSNNGERRGAGNATRGVSSRALRP